MRTFILILFCIVFFSCLSNKNVYKSVDFEKEAYQHLTIAILPFNITQTGHKAKNATDEAIKDANIKWGYSF